MNSKQLITILKGYRYVAPIFRGVYPIYCLPPVEDGAYVINTAPEMSMTKDVLINILLELLKEEREQRRKETENNASEIKELLFKLEKLETDLNLEHDTWNMYRHVGRTVCDGDEDKVDGWKARMTARNRYQCWN